MSVYRKKSSESQSGFVLVSVLWLIVLLTVIATGLAYSSRQSTQSMSSLIGGTQARYLAEGATQLALSNLLSQNPADRLLADGEQIELELPGGLARLILFDESGKIDINMASTGLLARLLYSLDVEESAADALADAIVDFRDEDDLTHLNGAEDDDYQTAGLTWGAKDSEFTDIRELQRVYGMQPEIFARMLPYVTIYSRQQGINPEVASLQVLLAVSENSVLSLESYIDQRRQNHRDGLSLPPAPIIPREFLSRSRGITYSMNVIGRTETGKESGISTTVRLRRSSNRLVIQTLAWQPYVEAPHNRVADNDNQAVNET